MTDTVTGYRVKLRCSACLHRYTRVLKLLSDKDPACPKCAKPQRKRRGMDVASGKAPAYSGKLIVRAVDEAARIVQEDYGLTDLRSDIRQGEIAAPKLPPGQQTRVDNFFGGGGGAKRRMPGPFGNASPALIRQAALSGQFMTPDTVNPIAAMHQARTKPAVHILNPDRNEK